MECALIQERLSEYIDGTLDEDDRKALENHMSTCTTCKEDLASLTEMVEELHAMDPVEAPADFLEKIHERMAPRFSLNRIIRKLFVPFRIKIPLELAAAATITVLVVFVFNIQQKEVPSVPIVSDSISEKIIEKPAEDRMMAAMDKEVKGVAQRLKTVPATPLEKEEVPLTRKSKGTTPVKPSTQRESKADASALGKAEEAPPDIPDIKKRTIELALVLETPPISRALEPGVAMKTARFQGKDEKTAGTERTEGDFFEKTLPDRQIAPAADLLSSLRNIVHRFHGKVSHVEINEKTDRLKSIETEIPARNYGAFCKELTRLAAFQAPPRPLSDKDPDTIQVRIGFIYQD